VPKPAFIKPFFKEGYRETLTNRIWRFGHIRDPLAYAKKEKLKQTLKKMQNALKKEITKTGVNHAKRSVNQNSMHNMAYPEARDTEVSRGHQ